MIALPRLDKKQKKDLDEMKSMEGWKLVTQIIEGSIQVSNAKLINWNFKFGEDGEPLKQSILDYREKRIEADLLKNFLHFVNNPVIIKDVEIDEEID